MNSRREFLFGAAAIALSGCGTGSGRSGIPISGRSPEVRALATGNSLIISRSRTRVALVNSRKEVITMSHLSAQRTAVKFASAAPIAGRVPVRLGSVTNTFSSGDSFRIHPFGMGEWKSADGSYVQILDLQDGTSVFHAPSLGLHFKKVLFPLSKSPYPAPVPKSLEVSARKVMTLKGTCDTCGDGSGDGGSGSGDPTISMITATRSRTMAATTGKSTRAAIRTTRTCLIQVFCSKISGHRR
jgi:hypothetical protein